jgi:hypothetical protein
MRAAWELRTGPTDWSDFDKLTEYEDLPAVNMNRPDIILPLADGSGAEGD